MNSNRHVTFLLVINYILTIYKGFKINLLDTSDLLKQKWRGKKKQPIPGCKKKRREGRCENQGAGVISEIIPVSTV